MSVNKHINNTSARVNHRRLDLKEIRNAGSLRCHWPLPVSLTVCGLAVGVSVKYNAPGRGPVVLGLKITPIVHDALMGGQRRRTIVGRDRIIPADRRRKWNRQWARVGNHHSFSGTRCIGSTVPKFSVSGW